ncbi:MAG: hypothetical protein ACE5HQ_10655 [Gemmatimonadota bacterium]
MERTDRPVSLGKLVVVGTLVGIFVAVVSALGVRMVAGDVDPAVIGGVAGGVAGGVVATTLRRMHGTRGGA